LGQADILRRAMGKKNKAEMLAQKKRFIEGAVAGGMKISAAETLFEQMNKFAGYGFNKCHSTPYGLLTYQTAFLKANYPIEFLAALMTLDMTNTDKLYICYQDAKKNNIKITPPDVNLSDHAFVIDHTDHSIRYSLTAIKGSGEQAVREIVKERQANGAFSSIFDFAERLSQTRVFTRRILEHFIKAGAFDKLHPNRRQLFESMEQIMSVKMAGDQASLFEKNYPTLVNVPEWNDTEKLQNEFAAVGFYISSHPMQQYANLLKKLHCQTLAEAKDLAKSRVAVIINNVIYKTTKNQNKFCILQVSDSSGSADVSLFSEGLTHYRDLLEVGNVVIMHVNCSKNEDQVRINAEKIQKFSEDCVASAQEEDACDAPPSASTSKMLYIRIASSTELHAVKKLVDNFKVDGDFNIVIVLPDSKKILLGKTYVVTSYDMLDLRNVVGINNVSKG
jgi:DNA polymerase-3 subunit alpha